MNPEIKAKWVTALRSGEYEQGNFCLKSEAGYCCLGVLCEISGMPFEEWAGVPPYEICQWAGLASSNPIVKTVEEETCRSLANLNDGGMSFNNIADIIEEQL
jgi:hypothetical protein